MERVIQVRTNINCSVDYETGALDPELELVLVTVQPEYIAKQKEDGGLEVCKIGKVSSVRVSLNEQKINELIGQLTIAKQNLIAYAGLSEHLSKFVKKADSDEKTD